MYSGWCCECLNTLDEKRELLEVLDALCAEVRTCRVRVHQLEPQLDANLLLFGSMHVEVSHIETDENVLENQFLLVQLMAAGVEVNLDKHHE